MWLNPEYLSGTADEALLAVWSLDLLDRSRLFILSDLSLGKSTFRYHRGLIDAGNSSAGTGDGQKHSSQGRSSSG